VVSDTKLNDVKLFQVHTLTSMMASFIQECGGSTDSSSSGTKGDTAVVFCGDFNSAPDSCVYEYLTNGALTPERLKEVDTTGALQRMGGGDVLWHDLDLESAYVSAIGHEPSYTNFTENFVGCLDYVFVSVPRVRVSAVLLPPLADELQDETALPSTQQPSDHVPMCADLFL
jgi:mRNA deadenylase 3'-5' endonuclease subunit Ccr4